MRKFLLSLFIISAALVSAADGFQLTNANFEDWSGAAFDGQPQPQGWNASNVEQMGFSFNFAHKETGRNGGYCMMVQDQSVGALGVTETSPGYFSIGKPWAYVASITALNKATAGTSGGRSWTHRPDTMSVWIRRTGDNWDKEDFYLLYYAWVKEAKGASYKGKNEQCTSHEEINEESDVRIAMNGNECKTTVAGEQVCEGMWRERKSYGQWTNIRVPIYYFNDNVPKFMNVIFSASNYPNFRANSGLYEGNSLYVDDVELIYSSKIHKLYVDGKEWKGFDPNTSDVQVYALGEDADKVPTLEAMRGAGSLTNARGATKSFPGRKLQGSEINIVYGDLDKKPTVITVTSEDGKSTTVYKIQFQRAASSNAKLASISINGEPLAAFSPTKYNYNVELPYGTTAAPVVTAEGQEQNQTIKINQPESINGTSTIVVTAANGTSKLTYTLTFKVGLLADNTLKDILINGASLPGFTPTQAVYKVSLPTTTTTMPMVEPVSAYPAGEQTIVHNAPATIDGGTYTLSVTTPGNQVAKVYKLNFKLEASSYSYLSDLTVGGQTVNGFAPDNFTYYVHMPMGTTTLPEIRGVKGEPSQTVEVVPLGEGVVDGTVRVIVTAGNKSDQSVYKIVFSTEKSENSSLAGIKIGGVALEDFAADKLSYSYALPVGTTQLLDIEAIPGDEYQTITVTTSGVNGKTRITVVAGDGSTTVYQIAFSVAAFSDNTLKALYLDGQLIEGFASDKDEYWVNLPQGTTTLPQVTYDLQNADLQSVSVRPLTNTLNGDYKITVRPQSGASRTYIIHFSLATSSNVNLKMIYVGGVALENFTPEQTAYEYHLPEGVSTIPTVTFDKDDATQRVLSVLENKTQTITVTAESGAKREYTILFIVKVSQNAFLEAIYLDGQLLDGFRKDSLNYIVQLNEGTCPLITVDKAAGQQVTITAPHTAGTATIMVKPEEGAPNTYTIQFVQTAVSTARLKDILINGTGIQGFDPSQMTYEASYESTKPEVTYLKEYAEQTVRVLWKDNVAWLHVQDTLGNNAAYSITFTRIPSSDNTLKAIYADGQLIDGFDPTRYNYSYQLEAGSTYPALSYETADKAQVVFFGQLKTGQYGIQVAAEDGTVAVYTVTYTVKAYTDATLQSLSVEGYDFVYDKAQTQYGPFAIEEGVALPTITAVPQEGQSVMVYAENDSTQHVLVMAENGTTNTYTVTYTRVKSSTVKLANILIDGKPLAGFDPDTLHYTISLARGAKVVPNIHPVAELDNQTITTYFSRPNGVTRIHVVAQDGAEGEYTIAFPVEQSHNTKLGSLMIDGITRDVNVTEYEFNVPFGTIEPYEIQFEKAEDEQLVHLIEAPLTGVSKIVVTSQTGDIRTYTIRYTQSEPQGENKIKNIKYNYINAAGETVYGEKQPVVGDNIIELPFGAKAFDVTEVEKNYPEQSVYFYNGGIRRGATIIVASNRKGEDDVTYTVTPQMPEYETAGKLSNLTFKGATVPNFRPDVYNYMVNVTAQPTAADFVGTAFGGKTVTKSTIDAKKKQIILTVSGGEKYSICWYYTNYETLLDFSGDWVNVSKGVGYKPSSKWTVPGDLVKEYTWKISLIVNLTYTTGKEVTPGGTNGVMLSTLRGAPMNTSVPGMMTLGSMSLTLGSSGNSSSSVSKGATVGTEFKNTPEAFEFLVKPLSTSNITNWKMWLTMSDGSNYKESNYTGDFSNLNKWTTVNVPISYSGVGTVSKFNVMLSSCDQENANQFNGNTIYESSVMYDNIHFVYNSELTGVTVNGKSTTKSGNTFTYTLGANEVILGHPSLKFTGAVHDQTQTIEWLNNGEWINGELRAKVTNYGENSKDKTEYTVVLKRTPVTSLDYTIDFGSYQTIAKDDTVFVEMPFGTKQLPSLTITPDNIHQRFAMTKRGNAVEVIVTAENNATKKTIYVFRENKPNSVEFESALTASDSKGSNVPLNVVDAEQFIYSVTAEQMPTIEYIKTLGQIVEINYTADQAQLIVTAADGTTQRTYTINRIDPVITTTGQIREFALGGEPWAKLGGDTYTATGDKPTQPITFERKFATDSVVYVQSPAKMEWQVYGDANHTYTLTYPTSKSSNAYLADLLIGGKSYSEFSATDYDYTIQSDSFLIINAIEAEAVQQLTTTQTTTADDIVIYQTTVTAEDGTSTKTYRVTVRRPLSSNATLAGIMLDSVMVTGFDPTIHTYTVTLPTLAVKTEQPKMPSVTYIAGHQAQAIVLTTGQLNGEPTTFEITAEDGTTDYYELTVKSAPSHCSDLTGITINGDAIDQFEAGRHHYSVSISTNEIEVDYASDDRFQTVQTQVEVVKQDHAYNYTLHVIAEDGTSSDYLVEVYVENQSNDAQLANITLDGKDFVDFYRALNADLKFDGGNKDYKINLPSGTTVLPEVNAQLKMDGQSVQITQKKDSILLDVTAVDGVTHNVYTLHFLVPQSKNADLSMIFLNGDSLPEFKPDYYFYQIDLPVGVHTMPEVAAQKGEAAQTILPMEIDQDKLQVTIKVQAEDPNVRQNTYVLVFHLTRSDADTLQMIYQDGVALDGFQPQTFYYTRSLPVGTTDFPDLSWLEVDDMQTITINTVEQTANTLIRQIIVTAESGRKNTYTVSYTIEKSDVDTLRMIFVDQKQLPGFSALTEEYHLTLSAAYAAQLDGQMPTIEYISGDEYQTVLVSQMPDSLAGKSLGYKTIITVTAATGKMRTYTIHYPVELSTETTLNMINLGGKPMANYDSERFFYKHEIDMDAAVPVVSVIKKEEAQTYEIQVLNDTVYVTVTAEDVTYQQTYTLVFERRMSAVTTLRDIVLSDQQGQTIPASLFPFRPEVYTYTVDLTYDASLTILDQLPSVEPVLYDALQTTDTTLRLLPNGDAQVEITVTAPNGEDQAIYTLTFHFIRPSDATLATIMVGGVEIAGFASNITEYNIAHPYGTAASDYYTQDDITFTLSDPLANATVTTNDEGVIFITIVAQDGVTENTYVITQTTGLDNDNTLSMITLDDEPLRGFDPQTTFYTYYIMEGGTAPNVQAVANSVNADVSMREAAAGDTCRIICTAADGSERRYYIHFAISSLNPGLEPTGNDVLFKRIQGSTQYMAATLRSGVTIALYDQRGQMVFYERVPVADPNDADVVIDAERQERLNDVIDTRSGLLIDVIPGQTYFYVFFADEKVKLGSGKFIAY